MVRLRLLAARRQQASAIRRVTRKPEVFGSPVGFSTDKRAGSDRPICWRDADFPLLIGASRRQITCRVANRNLEGGYGCPVARRLYPQSDTVTFLIAVNEPLNITSASS